MKISSCREVAKETGLGVEALENWLRTSAGPKDRGRIEVGGHVFFGFTPLGLKKFLSSAGPGFAQAAPPPPVEPALEISAEVIPMPRREDLRLVRSNLWSGKNVFAETSYGVEVQVSVKSAELLKDGMVLRECIEEPPFGWVYLGRLPRGLGEQQLYFPKQEVSA